MIAAEKASGHVIGAPLEPGYEISPIAPRPSCHPARSNATHPRRAWEGDPGTALVSCEQTTKFKRLLKEQN
jgi:hypothetical protein